MLHRNGGVVVVVGHYCVYYSIKQTGLAQAVLQTASSFSHWVMIFPHNLWNASIATLLKLPHLASDAVSINPKHILIYRIGFSLDVCNHYLGEGSAPLSSIEGNNKYFQGWWPSSRKYIAGSWPTLKQLQESNRIKYTLLVSGACLTLVVLCPSALVP